MSTPTSPTRTLLGTLLAVGVVGLGYLQSRTAAELSALRLQAAERSTAEAAFRESAQETLDRINAEISRMRVEQRIGSQGPKALLEMLRIHADTLVNARATAPDFQNAQEQMRGVMRAFAAIGEDGTAPLRRRFDELDPKSSFDELRWILEALIQCDPDKGKQLTVQVLEGRQKPSPRLRWAAAELLQRTDRPLAQRTLRQVLLTETSRGVDPDRASVYNLPILDPAAVAATGFFNFVIHYLRTEDPQAEETLLQVLTRPQQDIATLQETIEALGSMKSARAQKRIEELYEHPPGAQQNPLFLNKCLDALVAIRGKDSKPWLQQQLAKAEHELVTQHIDRLLQEIEHGKKPVQQGAATPGEATQGAPLPAQGNGK
jgi:hypothetical protein